MRRMARKREYGSPRPYRSTPSTVVPGPGASPLSRRWRSLRGPAILRSRGCRQSGRDEKASARETPPAKVGPTGQRDENGRYNAPRWQNQRHAPRRTISQCHVPRGFVRSFQPEFPAAQTIGRLRSFSQAELIKRPGWEPPVQGLALTPERRGLGHTVKCALRLEREFQSELDQSRRLGLQNLVESLRVHVAVRIVEVRMVQDVEELCPELDTL